MKIHRLSVFTVVFLLFSNVAGVAKPEGLLDQQQDGGWKGGDSVIMCDVSGAPVAAGVKDGKAVVIHSGSQVLPLEITYTPYGFVLTGGSSEEGATYTVNLSRKHGGPRLIWAPFGPEYKADDPIGLGFGPRLEMKCKWARWR